ncbi:TonB-dependent receptor [Cupriavidus basilensis]|uniref:TonB-dependent receptor n=1 Tax=Cupriavidus basilensis TaxID=68895 RepID=A0A643FPD4_9BURK|nr:TonB-dependent receptor [Cupriavidus basilensis]QOT80870.1 TonB-dependent receptor [Cupriavidus basilensis]
MSARPRIAHTASPAAAKPPQRRHAPKPPRQLAQHCALALSLGAFAGIGADAAWAAEDAQPSERAQSQRSRGDSTVLPPVVVSSASQPPGLALSEPTSTGSRLGLTPLETPASVEVLSGDTIRERGDLSVREAVTRATGITSNGAPGNGGTALAARGFAGQGSVMQLYDGTRLYVASGTVTFPFDTWSVDRIEVLRGAASVMVGEGAIGGVVNVIPKKPMPAPIANELQLTGGTQKTARAAFDSGGAVNETLSYRLNASYGRSGGWVDRGDSRSLAVSAAVRLDVSPEFNLTLSYDDADQHPMQYLGTPLAAGSLDTSLRKKNYNVGDADITYRDRWTRLAAQWQPNERVTVRNQFYYLTSQRHWRDAESYTLLPATGQVRRTDYLEILHDQEQVGDRADLMIDGQLFGMANTAMVGFDVNRINFTHSNNSPYGGASTVNAYQFDPGQFFSPPGIVTSPRFRTHTTQAALFGEDRLQLTRQWSVIGGVRLDHAQLERGNLVTGDDWTRSFNNITWRAGTVYAFTPALSVYAQYATATDPLGALISTSDAQKDFKLATGRQIEAGVKQSFWNQRGEWTFAAYQIVKKNLLTRDASNPALSVQVGEQSSRGLEASVSVALMHGLRLDANGTVLRARYDNFAESVNGALVSRNGNVPTSVAQQAANLWLTWAFAPQWQAGGGLRYVGKRYTNNANTTAMPSYTVVDASLQWRASRKTALTLRVYNLFNRDYAESAGNSGGQWLLGRPRAAELSANFYF